MLSRINFTVVLDFTNQIEEWLKGELDFVLYNNFLPDKDRINRYKKDHPELLEMIKIDKNLQKEKFIGKNLISDKNLIEHDPYKTSKALISLI